MHLIADGHVAYHKKITSLKSGTNREKYEHLYLARGLKLSGRFHMEPIQVS
jgi:hypothetical protein